MAKNILIYLHTPCFNYEEGGTVVQFNLAKILDDFGQNVRIHVPSGIKLANHIFNKYYDNDFPIDENVVVVYCEGIQGNPLGAKYVVRWMLSVLGQNVSFHNLITWAKDELVYHFNSEPRFFNFPERKNTIYKLLSCLYLNPDVKQTYFGERNGYCFALRKAFLIHKSIIYLIHPKISFEITKEHSQSEYIEFFNKYEFFVSYDSNTFLTMIAAMCGCISIVYKVDNLSKSDWLKTTAAAEYLKNKGLDSLYGIAYGVEEIDHAKNTIHLAKKQWDEIINYNNQKTIVPFLIDINNFEKMKNTIQNNYFI